MEFHKIKKCFFILSKILMSSNEISDKLVVSLEQF